MFRKLLVSLLLGAFGAAPARADGGETTSLATALAKRTTLSEAEARDRVEQIFSVIRAELKAGNSIEVRKFGRFTVRERAVRRKKSRRSAMSAPGKRKYPHFVSAESLKLELNPQRW